MTKIIQVFITKSGYDGKDVFNGLGDDGILYWWNKTDSSWIPFTVNTFKQ